MSSVRKLPPQGSRSGSGHGAHAGSLAEAKKLQDQLGRTLNALKENGDFATRKQYAQFANPGLQIGDTLIALPLDPAQVPLIRDASRQAPFGRGEETLVDTSVRNTWELDASKFLITNPAWAAFIDTVLQQLSKTLGMTNVRIELYKLLLYEKGSFFKRHRDSEKAPGMIATMSVCLPSKYQGGEVRVSHAGANRVFDTSKSLFDISALAWYSDVSHEIKPITEGHRLTLIYNIIKTNDGASSAEFFVQQNQKVADEVANLRKFITPQRLLYFLEHKYSLASLSIDQLKGRDRAVAKALQPACANNGWHLFLCNVTRASDSEGYYERFSWQDHENPEFMMDDITTCGGKVLASKVEFQRRDILGKDPYTGKARKADSESEGEETGNEGVPIEYRYHDSALLLIPKERLEQVFDISSQYDASVEMDVIVDLIVQDFRIYPNDPATRRAGISVLARAAQNDWTIASRVMKLAWQMKEDDLFRNAVHAGFQDGIPHNAVIPALVDIVKNEPAGPIDWEKCLGQFASSHPSLTRLSASLDTFKRMLGDHPSQASLLQWQSALSLLTFEAKTTLSISDYDAAIELTALHWENVDWIQNKLLPKVRDNSDIKFLSKFVCTLLQKDREGVLEKAKDIVRVLLQTETKRIHLKRIAFTARSFSAQDRVEFNRFADLLSECAKSGLQEYVDELLRLSQGTVESAPLVENRDAGTYSYYGRPLMTNTGETTDNLTLAERMLDEICGYLEDAKMPVPNDAMRDFFTAVLKKYVVTDRPKWPEALPGHSHRPRGCGNCTHCPELNAFLTSPYEWEHEFVKGPRICEHLEMFLNRSFFEVTKTPALLSHGPQKFCLKVVKLGKEYQADVDKYEQDLAKALKKTEPFRCDFVRGFLGDALYDELITMRHLPLSGDHVVKREGEEVVPVKREEAAPMAVKSEEGTTVAVKSEENVAMKREAEEPELPALKKIKKEPEYITIRGSSEDEM